MREPDYVTPGVEKQCLQVDYHIEWQDTKRINEAQDAAVQELAKLSGPDPEFIALTTQYNKLADQYGKALAQKNNAEATRIYKELEAVGQKMQAVSARRDKEMEAVQAKMDPHDVRARIILIANSLYEGIYQKNFNPAPCSTKPSPTRTSKQSSLRCRPTRSGLRRLSRVSIGTV